MFTAIHNSFNGYVDFLPRQIPMSIFRSAVYSFAVSALFADKPETAALAGAIAATLSAIDSLTMPFFRHSCANANGDIAWYQNVARTIVNLAITDLLFRNLTPYRTHLLAMSTFAIGMQFFFRGLDPVSTIDSHAYFYVMT